MRLTSAVVRVVFIALALVTHARPALAMPHWQEYCDPQCNGQVRVWECSFVDNNDYFYEESDCYNDEEEWRSAYHHYDSLCYQYSGGDAGYFFNMTSCHEDPTRGTFYCSYSDISCGQ